MALELITTCLGLFSDPIKEYIITPLKNHISYPFTCDSNVERLHQEIDKLQNKRDRLQESVKAATRNNEQIHKNVSEWLISAKKDIEEAEKLVQGKEDAKKKCCSGFCPNLKTRYKLSKKAHKKAAVMDEQLKSEKELYPISSLTPPPPIIEHAEALQSRVLILDQIVDALKDPNLNMIGAHGMGGIGKTTLAKEVLGQAAVLKLFDDVVLVAVTETPKPETIQQDIADALGLKFQAKGVPGRASELHQRLKEAQVLIILDDVWEKLDLYAIGIPSGEASKSCKIFLTSRKKDVLCSEMRTKKEFPLGLLGEGESWRLFEKIVNTGDDPEFLANNRDLAEEVAKKCGGLPLLIEKVATDLRNHKQLSTWKDMLKQLEDVEGTEIEVKVHKVIESSYKNMKDEKAKSLFLLCPLFGNSNIRIPDLLLYCMGLGLFKRDSIEESRNRVLTLIDKLKNESLLLKGDKAGFVKIHDVVRDIAAAIASKEHCTFVGKRQIKSTDLESQDCRRISLPYCVIPQLPEVLQCPEAEVFSLFAEDLSLHIPDSFFKGVAKLKVLHFTGVSFESGLPSSISFLTGLQTLSLEGCKLINVAMVAELKQLEVLNFAGSGIEELPTEIEALTQLKLLNLTDCDHLKVIPSNVLSNLHSLEELYMLNSFDAWDTEGNASLVELKNLSSLATLEIKVKDDKLLPEDWFFNGIQNYKIYIGNWPWSPAEETSRMLALKLKTSIGLIPRIKEFLRGAEVLYLGEVNGLENLSCDSSMEKINSFQRLRRLSIEASNSLRELLPFSKNLAYLQEMKVRFCDNMEAIVGEGNENEVMEFTQLTSLILKYLPHLNGFCRTSGTVVSFPNLTSLEIFKCNNLKYVFTTSIVKSLKQLKKLEISYCESTEEIILVNKCDEVVVFPELEHLQLYDLPNLKRFIPGYPVEFPKLKELSLSVCNELKNFVPKISDRSNSNEISDEYLFIELVTFPNLEIIRLDSMRNLRYLWHQKFADNDSFSKLKKLNIGYCSKLSVVFPSNAYGRFLRLESLEVSNCCGLEEIYEYKAHPSYEAFALRHVCIRDLRSLKHIWSTDMDEAFISFQNLQSVRIDFCPDLKYVFPASISCGLLQLQHLEIDNCGVEMIIAEPKHQGSEGASTTRDFEWPKLESYKVSDCGNLIKFGSNISKARDNIPTQDSHYSNQKVIPNAKVSELNRHSLKAIQSDDHGFPSDSLWKLKEATLDSIKEESVPFLFDFLRRIYSVEKLIFSNSCLGDIFPLHDERATGDHLRVKQLDLFSVSKLKHIVKDDSQLDLNILQFLQILSVSDCDDMMNIAPSSSVSFQNLTTLHVYQCDKMTSLVTASTAKSMIQLMVLKVSNCSMMEDIIIENNYDGDCTEEHDGVITFSKLQYFELEKLPNLNSFCSGNYNINFPLIERVYVYECNQMKNFCGGEVSTPKLQGIQYGYQRKPLWEGNLKDTIIASQSPQERVLSAWLQY